MVRQPTTTIGTCSEQAAHRSTNIQHPRLSHDGDVRTVRPLQSHNVSENSRKPKAAPACRCRTHDLGVLLGIPAPPQHKVARRRGHAQLIHHHPVVRCRTSVGTTVPNLLPVSAIRTRPCQRSCDRPARGCFTHPHSNGTGNCVPVEQFSAPGRPLPFGPLPVLSYASPAACGPVSGFVGS